MIVGLISPSLVARITRKLYTRSQVLTRFSLACLGFFVLLVITSDAPAKSTDSVSQATNTVAVVDAKPAVDPEEVLKKDAESALGHIKEFDESLYRGDASSAILGIAFIQALAETGKKAQASSSTSTRQVGDTLIKAVKKLQIEQFPKMRKVYGDAVSQAMWVNDVSVGINGVGNSTITFVAAPFATNRNVAKIHSEVVETLTALRFKRANYKWIPSASEYPYYKIESLNDGDIK